MKHLLPGSFPYVLACSLLLLVPSSAQALNGGTNCEVTGCGGNTPIIFGSPIIGLSLNGDSNSRGVVLDPQLVRVAPPAAAASACPAVATLDVQNGELIGRWATGSCKREGLIGMALTLWVPITPCEVPPPDTREALSTASPAPCGRRERIRVRFGAVSAVPTWEVQDAEEVITYQLVWHELPPAGSFSEDLVVGESICPLREAWMEDWQNGTVSAGTGTGFHYERWKEETDQLLIVHGETYHADGRVDMQRRGLQWLNLACVGSALAKSRLLGNDPAAAPAQWPLRQATLKMLTARYKGQRSYTRPGVPLAYQRAGKSFYGQPTSGVNWNVQGAAWDEDGAMCVSHRRTWKEPTMFGLLDPMLALAQWLLEARPEGAPEDEPVLLPPGANVYALYEDAEEASLEPLRLGGIPTCGNVPPSGWIWRTFPVNHFEH